MDSVHDKMFEVEVLVEGVLELVDVQKISRAGSRKNAVEEGLIHVI